MCSCGHSHHPDGVHLNPCSPRSGRDRVCCRRWWNAYKKRIGWMWKHSTATHHAHDFLFGTKPRLTESKRQFPCTKTAHLARSQYRMYSWHQTCRPCRSIGGRWGRLVRPANQCKWPNEDSDWPHKRRRLCRCRQPARSPTGTRMCGPLLHPAPARVCRRRPYLHHCTAPSRKHQYPRIRPSPHCGYSRYCMCNRGRLRRPARQTCLCTRSWQGRVPVFVDRRGSESRVGQPALPQYLLLLSHLCTGVNVRTNVMHQNATLWARRLEDDQTISKVYIATGYGA